MKLSHLYSILPMLITAGAAILIMLIIAIKRNHFITYLVSLLSFAAAFISLSYVSESLPTQIGFIAQMDSYAVFFQLLIFGAGFVITVLSYDYLKAYPGNREEYYILLLLASLGASILVISTHFITFFLGLELLSVSLYGMIAYTRMKKISIEAGLKYLILAAVSSAFLLFGMALVYAGTGAMNFSLIFGKLVHAGGIPVYLYMGFAFIAGGTAFKLALAPFHMWTPDVYQGSPAPVSAFIASVSKGAVFALLLRMFSVIDVHQFPSLQLFFVVIAIISMFTGNLLALLQNNIKRLLAYSSIAHLGYLLIAFIAEAEMGMEAASFYLLAYMITIIGAFGVVSAFSSSEKDADLVSNYKGLFWRKPYIAIVFTAMLLSLAGIPLTAGFLGKFYVALSGVESGRIGLVLLLVINSVIGLYYYLKVIVAMFSGDPQQAKTKGKPVFSLRIVVVLSLLFLLLIWYGLFPQGMINFIQNFVVL